MKPKEFFAKCFECGKKDADYIVYIVNPEGYVEKRLMCEEHKGDIMQANPDATCTNLND